MTHAHVAAAGPVALVAAFAIGYEVLAAPRRWPVRRTAFFQGGCLLLVVGLTVPVGTFADHTARHLLIGMLAPLCLVLGAPAALLLRALPPAAGRRLARVLRTPPVHLLTRPATALLLTTGGVFVLHLTPLYAATAREPVLHDVVELHFLLSGYLFAWVVAGPDPAPDRPSVRARLVVLGVAVAGHAILSQLLYAGLWVDVPATAADRRAGATLMYYGGDVAELLVAVALVARARPEPGRRRSRSQRRRSANVSATQSAM